MRMRIRGLWSTVHDNVRLRLRISKLFDFDEKSFSSRGYKRHVEYLKRLQVGVAARHAVSEGLLTMRVDHAVKEASELVSQGRVVSRPKV